LLIEASHRHRTLRRDVSALHRDTRRRFREGAGLDGLLAKRTPLRHHLTVAGQHGTGAQSTAGSPSGPFEVGELFEPTNTARWQANGEDAGADVATPFKTNTPPGQLAPRLEPEEVPREDAPRERGRVAAFFLGAAKVLALALVVAGAYTGYVVYERRQPYEWSGSVEMHTVGVGSRVGGRVKSVLVREGQAVVKGDVLVALEPGQLEAQKLIAESDVRSAEAIVIKLENGARPQEVAQAMARLAAAQAQASQASGLAEHAEKEFSRADTLVSTGALSPVEREAAQSRARAAKASTYHAFARAKEDEAALRLLTSGTRPEDLRIAHAQLDAARARLALINTQFEELSVRAPNPARVEVVAIRPGDLLRPDTRAVTLLEAGELYVRIYIPEPKLGLVRVGQEVPVSVDSFPHRNFRGRIEHINEVGEFTPRRLITTEERADEVFAARVALLEGDAELKAGMAAFIHVKK
jgi:HlyD family secretion protein